MIGIRVGLVLALIGCSAMSVSAQESVQPAGGVRGVTLGVPRPLPMFTPPIAEIQQASYVAPPTVVRGLRSVVQDEPKALFLPDALGPTRERQLPAPIPNKADPDARTIQGVQSAPGKARDSVIEIDEEGKPRAVPVSNPGTPKNQAWRENVSDRPQVLEECDSCVFGPLLSHRVYVRAEALYWSARGFRVPPLVTTAPASDPEATRGALGFGNTRVLFGDTTLAGGGRPGARFTLGWNYDPCGIDSIEANFFFLSNTHDNARFNSTDIPVLARPFFNLNTGAQDRNLATTPLNGVFAATGNVVVESSSSLLGAELNKRHLILCGADCRVTGFVGFRFLNLEDRLGIIEEVNVVTSPPPFAPGLRGIIFDQFDTTNRFYGGQIGVDGEMRRGRWVLEGRLKLALGCTHQTVGIDGGQNLTAANGAVSNFRGGLYALSSNIGQHSQTRVGFVPEAGLKIGYDLNDSVRVFVGYDVLFWSSVLRPGDQIDPVLDANLIPNSGAPFPNASQARPRVPFRTTSYWAQGVSAGLEIRY